MPEALTTVSTTATVPVGTVMKDVGGNKEYIYLSGAASTVANDWGTYDSTYAFTRGAAGGQGSVCVAMAAVDATTEYGWFQIRGAVTGNVGATTTANRSVYWHATGGTVSTTGVAGDWISGAHCVTAGSSTATFMINYPCAYGADNGYLT